MSSFIFSDKDEKKKRNEKSPEFFSAADMIVRYMLIICIRAARVPSVWASVSRYRFIAFGMLRQHLKA